MVPTMMLMMAGISTAPVPTGNVAAIKKEQEECWADLMKDETTAVKAILKLSRRPKETVLFLKEKLKPIKIEKAEVKKLIKDLESEDEKIWMSAFEKLQFYDPRLAMSVKDAFDAVSPGAGQSRLVALFTGNPVNYFEGMQFTFATDENSAVFLSGNRGWGAALVVSHVWTCGQWFRQTRCILLLEHIGTRDAIDVLIAIAKGHPDVDATKTAKEALKNLQAE